jgi:hypothetical protein
MQDYTKNNQSDKNSNNNINSDNISNENNVIWPYNIQLLLRVIHAACCFKIITQFINIMLNLLTNAYYI